MKIREAEADIIYNKDVLNLIEETDLNNATYNVFLRSHWKEEDETDVELTYTGSLKDAVMTAKEQFRKNNKSCDIQAIQADYIVHIVLGYMSYLIPEKNFETYKDR